MKEHAETNDVHFKYIPSSQNLADFLTKPFPRETLQNAISTFDLGPQTSSTAVQEEC